MSGTTIRGPGVSALADLQVSPEVGLLQDTVAVLDEVLPPFGKHAGTLTVQVLYCGGKPKVITA
jgi:hypothetical protein